MWQPELRPEGSLDLTKKREVRHGGPSRQKNNVCSVWERTDELEEQARANVITATEYEACQNQPH